jgi:hypothetical protein
MGQLVDIMSIHKAIRLLVEILQRIQVSLCVDLGTPKTVLFLTNIDNPARLNRAIPGKWGL